MLPKQSDVLAYRSVYGDPRGRGGASYSVLGGLGTLLTFTAPSLTNTAITNIGASTTISPTTGSETRPANIALNGIIKY